MVRHQPSDSSTHAVSAVLLSGHLMVRGSRSFLIATITLSSVSTQTTRHRSCISRRRRREIRVHDGRQMENESHLYDDPEPAALLKRFSNSARKRGPSGPPTPQRAKHSNSGRARSHCEARRRPLTAARICIGPPPVASSSSRISTVSRICIRYRKRAANQWNYRPATTWPSTSRLAAIGVT